MNEKKKFLLAGRIVNTHGVAGEAKIECLADSPESLAGVKTFYLGEDGTSPLCVVSSRAAKSVLLCSFQGINDVSGIIPLRGKQVYAAREEISREEGRIFIADIVGSEIIDADTGAVLGTLRDVVRYGVQDTYEIDCGGRIALVPAVPEFVKKIDADEGRIYIKPIEGLLD